MFLGDHEWLLLAIGAFLSIWLIMSPLISLYWVSKPAERFWRKHIFISSAIVLGSFLGCTVIITAGVHCFLWFIPDAWLFEKLEVPLAKWLVSCAIGFFTTLALWAKFYKDCEDKRQEQSEERISGIASTMECDLKGDRTTRVALLQRIEEFEKLQRENQFDPFREEEIIALERVWYGDKKLSELLQRKKELEKLNAEGKLGRRGHELLHELTLELCKYPEEEINDIPGDY
jgi:membrane protein implicated in regulation of membrane protease activity